MTKTEKEKIKYQIRNDIKAELAQEINKMVSDKVDNIIHDTHISGYPIHREGAKWTENEEEVLRSELYHAILLIAAAHRRTPDGIKARLKKLEIFNDYCLI